MANGAEKKGPALVRLRAEEWSRYFLHNGEALLPIPWERGAELSDSERQTVARSIQEFQLGESSEGRHLFYCARRYARRTGDDGYVSALGLFVAEEHRHARDLGRVLDLADIPRARAAWPDTVFRWLRKRAGLELSIAVLVTAEIIAKVYYLALRGATESSVLRRLCDQILYDEVRHVHFQTERVAILRRGRARWLVVLTAHLHRLFMTGTCLVVWRRHGKVFRAGRFTFARFWHETWREMRDALMRMDPTSYHFATAEALLSPVVASAPLAAESCAAHPGLHLENPARPRYDSTPAPKAARSRSSIG